MAALVDTSTLKLERLCEHHICSSFDCGDATINETLHQCQEAFKLGSESLVFVLADDDSHVKGYVYMHDEDYVFSKRDNDPEDSVLRYCMIPAIGVSQDTRGQDGFFTLAEIAIKTAFLRKKRLEDAAAFEWEHNERKLVPETYRGFLCISFTNKKLQRLLERWGFKPFPINSFYVWRPFPESDQLPSRG